MRLSKAEECSPHVGSYVQGNRQPGETARLVSHLFFQRMGQGSECVLLATVESRSLANLALSHVRPAKIVHMSHVDARARSERSVFCIPPLLDTLRRASRYLLTPALVLYARLWALIMYGAQ